MRAMLVVFLLAAGIFAEKIVMLFPAGPVLQPEEYQTVHYLVLDNLRKVTKAEVVTPADSSASCEEPACIRKVMESLGADKAVVVTVRKLGQNIIYGFSLHGRDGGVINTQRATIEKIEDFEPMTERLVTALIENKTVDQTATVDNVSVTEAEKEPVRRTGYYSGGLLVGITYPLGEKYYAYLDDDSNWVKKQQFVKVGWLSMFEFKNGLAFNTTLLGNIPVSIGGDLDLIWLTKKTDVCPFVGGGLGLHYVKSDQMDDSSDKTNFGPTVNAQGGVLLFRTYNIRLMLRAQYTMVFNTDMDQGLSIDAITMYHPTPSEVKAGESETRGSSLLKVSGLALIVVLFTMGMVSYYN